MHQQCYLCVHCPKQWATPMNGKREGLRRWLQMENIRSRSENHVPISAVLKNLVYPMSLRRRWVTDCKPEMPDHQDRTREDLKSDVPREENSGQASGDRLHVPGVQGTRRPVASRKFQNGFNLSKKASLVTFTDSHNVTRRPLFIYRENNGDAVTADHKVLTEENESRLQHRYAVVVRDIGLVGSNATQQQIKNAQDTMRSETRHCSNK